MAHHILCYNYVCIILAVKDTHLTIDTPSNSEALLDEICTVVIDTAPVAYIRPFETENGKNYAVCTADGNQLAVFSSQDAAYFAAKQHDLSPMLIH